MIRFAAVDESAYPLHAEVEERHWWFVARRRILAEVIRGLGLPPNANLLEVGAGTGGNLPLLLDWGRVWAVEPSDEARRISAARTPQARHLPDLESLPGDARFAAAFMLDVLEHLDEPVSMLRQIAARMESGAHLVITVPAHGWLYGEHDRYLHHRLRYSEAELRRDLEAGGFSVESLSPMNAALFPAAVAARALEWLRSRGKDGEARPRGMTVPPTPINRALTELFAAERFVIPKRRLPFGLSLLATARR